MHCCVVATAQFLRYADCFIYADNATPVNFFSTMHYAIVADVISCIVFAMFLYFQTRRQQVFRNKLLLASCLELKTIN